MKILTLNYEYPPLGGGSSPVTRRLARALVERGHQVDLVTTAFRGLRRRDEDGGVRVLRVRALRSRMEMAHVHELASFLPGAWLRTWSLIRERAYDICHCHFLIPTGLVPFALRRHARFPPYVVTCHGSDVPGYNPDRFTRLHRLSPPVLRRIGLAAASVVVPSAALAELLARGVDELGPRIRRIRYGIDTDALEPGEKAREILVAARLFERKGVHDVLAALAHVALDGYAIHVAGDGPERRRLETMGARLALSVHFHGWLEREAMNRRFRRARIFVLATSMDNFPASLLEAMAAGCAIVTTRAGGCPEVVGDAAILVDPGDGRALRAAISRLVESGALCEKLGARARRRAVAEFGWDAIARGYEIEFRRAVEESTEARTVR